MADTIKLELILNVTIKLLVSLVAMLIGPAADTSALYICMCVLMHWSVQVMRACMLCAVVHMWSAQEHASTVSLLINCVIMY